MINFGKVIIDQTKAGSETVNYEGSSKPTFTISSSKTTCTAVTTSITPILPVSQTLYFGENGRVVDANGDFYLTNQGYGVLGTTDANGVLTVNTLVPAVSITAPSASAEYEIGDTVTVTWTSYNVANLDLVVESATGILTVEDIDASLGTYDITLTAETGTFNANQDITISLTDCIGVASDSVDIVSIATLTMETPTDVVAGEDYDYTGTSNGSEVELFYSLAGEDDWTSLGTAEVVDGDWTITGTIADADTYDFKAQDTTDPDGFALQENVVVASGVVLTALQITNATTATTGASRPNQIVDDGDDVYICFITYSTKLNIKGTDYSTGATATDPTTGIIKMTKTQEISWVKFFPDLPASIGIYTPTNMMAVDANGVYVLERSYPSSKLQTIVRKLSKADGTTSASLTLTKESSHAWGVGCGIYNNWLYVVGQTTVPKVWKVALDLGSQTLTALSGDISTVELRRASIKGRYAYCMCGAVTVPYRVDLSDASSVSGITNALQENTCNIGVNSSGNTLLFGKSAGTSKPSVQRRSTGFTTRTGSIDPYPDVAWSSIYRGAGVSGGDGYFYIVRKHVSDQTIIISRITDNDDGTLTSSDIKTLTPNSASLVYTAFSDIFLTTNHLFVTFNIRGNYESGFIPGDNTKDDIVILAVAK